MKDLYQNVKNTFLGPTFMPPAHEGIGSDLPELQPQFDFDGVTPQDIEGSCRELVNVPGPGADFRHPEQLPANDAALLALPTEQQKEFQNLKLAFNSLVCKTYKLLGAINTAVQAGSVPAYLKASKDYTEFTKNFGGYGEHFKKTSIEALIGPDPNGRNIIIGARIQVVWNPHLSSSGIPIQHNP
jgi:hypothetical protein